MDIGIFFTMVPMHGCWFTQGWLTLAKTMVQYYGRVYTEKKVMATESPLPGLPSAISITSLPICSRPRLLFYSVQLRDPSLQSTSAHVTNWEVTLINGFSQIQAVELTVSELWGLTHPSSMVSCLATKWSNDDHHRLWKTPILLPLTVSQLKVLQCSEIWPVCKYVLCKVKP